MSSRASRPKSLAQSVSESLHAMDLREVVRHAAKKPVDRLIHWRLKPLGEPILNSTTGGVFRLQGTAESGSGTFPWKVILKVLQRPRVSRFTDEADWNYWKGEALAYEALEKAGRKAGLQAARCFRIQALSPKQIMLLLEEVDAENTWDLEHYLAALPQMARFNARTDLKVPLKRDWFAGLQATQSFSRRIFQAPGFWNNPWVKRAFPQEHAQTLENTCEKVLKWKAKRLATPLGPAHLDLQASNLFWTGRRMVAIDWSNLSKAPLGSDVGQLLASLCMWLGCAEPEYDLFLKEAPRRYREGLPRELRRTVSADALEEVIRQTCVLRLACMAPWVLATWLSPQGRRLFHSKTGKPLKQCAKEWGQRMRWGLHLAELL